jgi:hypothetical protein
MNVKVTDTVVLELCEEFGLDVPLIVEAIKKRFPDYGVRPYRIVSRINKLRAKGMLPLDSGNYVSSGEILKGSSTLYDEDGNVKVQWVKTDRDKQDVLDDVRSVIDAYVEGLPKFKKVEYDVTYASSDLMAVYPLGDPHIGMKAYKEESGENWDLKTAQEVFCGVFDRLVKTAPSCEKAVIVNLGDYFHRDNVAGVTERHRHVLDTDGNYMMMVDTGLKIMLQMITSALEHHQKVQVITTIGNHDDTGSMFLQAALKHMYQDEPRVDIGCTSSVFQYFEHGKCFFGVHHGHTCKAEKLPLVMATDRPKEWGNSQFRYFLTGHIHHDSRKEYSGCSVESFRTLASKDSYAHMGGYRAGQDSKALVIHKDYGEVERHTINIVQCLPK